VSETVTIITPQREGVLQYLNPLEPLRDIWVHRHLIRQFAIRDIVGRYKGSWLGMVWSIINPLVMLAIYTFVFSVVFKMKWGQAETDSHSGFAINLFAGLVVFNLFSECVNRSPSLVIANPNYVKKVVFPLQTLPVAAICSALFLAGINTILVLIANLALNQTICVTALCFPLLLVPLLLITAGSTWFLASLGVYLRDMVQVVGIVTQILFYVTPIFYPMSLVPERFRVVMQLNPLTHLTESARQTLLWNMWPDWYWLAGMTVLSAIIAQLGYAWFMKTKRGFADVI
jgi:lipopolysaccharide transport system permease protein